jgi:hypothetical protein
MTVLLHAGNGKKVKQLFYATLHSLMMGQWDQKHVYCDSDELFAFIGLHFGNPFTNFYVGVFHKRKFLGLMLLWAF